MADIKQLKAKVDVHPLYGVPRRIYDFERRPAKATVGRMAARRSTGADDAACATAESFLKKVAKHLKIEPDLSQLRFDKVTKSILGSHVLFQQYHDGKPISGAWVKVDLDKHGNVFNVVNDLVPAPFMRKAAKQAKKQALTRAEALQRALAAVRVPAGKLQKVEEPESVFYPVDGVPTLAWKVMVKGAMPPREFKVYVDAQRGKILDTVDLLKHVDGSGKVFNPNPVVALNDTKLKNSSMILPKAYVRVKLKELAGTGFLDGPYVSTRRTPNRVKSTNGKYNFTRKDRAFKEVMAYFHIDTVQRYIQSLGFDNVNNRSIEVNIDGTKEDNSNYSPMTKSLTFGTGGVDDAEDADIILHEYGHSIQDNQVPGFGPSGESRAMGEGFGDYLAASFTEHLKQGGLKPCVGSWDAVAYSTDRPPALRRVDGKKRYPADLTGEEHDDGEIWSSCLWEVRKTIGRKTMDALVLAHHFLITPKASFRDAAEALVTADKHLNRGKHEAVIRDVFTRRGILKATKATHPRRRRKAARRGRR